VAAAAICLVLTPLRRRRHDGRRTLLRAGAVTLLSGLAGLIALYGITLSVFAWREHPAAARLVLACIVAGLAGGIWASMLPGGVARRRGEDSHHAEDGGVRRPPPPGPRPRSPHPVAPDWSRFDDVREHWEQRARAPAGSRGP
jgi:hypothetical protein